MTNDEILDYLHQNNGEIYNLHKASEELLELALVLNQKMLKPGKINDQEIIDEIGDVLIRVKILCKMFPMDEIQKRIDFKLSKYLTYIDHQNYKHI